MQDFFENAQPRVVAMLLGGILLLVVAVELTYLVGPQVKQLRQLYATHGMLEQTASSGGTLRRQLEITDTEVQDLLHQLHGDMAQLPEKEMESFVIGRLQRVSWATEVELVSVQPGSGLRVQDFRETLFEVRLKAGFHDFFEWLQIVNDELGYIVVKKFEIGTDDRDELGDPKLSLSLTLVSYRMLKSYAS